MQRKHINWFGTIWKTHEAALQRFLELPNGIPSHDTFGDVLGRLEHTAIDRLFSKRLTGIREKSNEITAIPELLDTLDIAGATVTIDAMGTQTVIAVKIVRCRADYILGLKGNQPTLLEDARLYFEENYLTESPALSAAECYAQTIDKGHGRIDKREC